jgi:hypothetical protein
MPRGYNPEVEKFMREISGVNRSRGLKETISPLEMKLATGNVYLTSDNAMDYGIEDFIDPDWMVKIKPDGTFSYINLAQSLNSQESGFGALPIEYTDADIELSPEGRWIIKKTEQPVNTTPGFVRNIPLYEVGDPIYEVGDPMNPVSSSVTPLQKLPGIGKLPYTMEDIQNQETPVTFDEFRAAYWKEKGWSEELADFNDPNYNEIMNVVDDHIKETADAYDKRYAQYPGLRFKKPIGEAGSWIFQPLKFIDPTAKFSWTDVPFTVLDVASFGIIGKAAKVTKFLKLTPEIAKGIKVGDVLLSKDNKVFKVLETGKDFKVVAEDGTEAILKSDAVRGVASLEVSKTEKVIPSTTLTPAGDAGKITSEMTEKLKKLGLSTDEIKAMSYEDAVAKVGVDVTDAVKVTENVVENATTVPPKAPTIPVAPKIKDIPIVGKVGVKEGIPEAIKAAEKVIPEKAANIRLDKYPEEIRDTVKQWADTHVQEVQDATRGVIPDAEVLDMAKKLTTETGGDLSKLEKKWKPGTSWNAEELVAIRGVLREKTTAVMDAQKLLKTGGNSTQNLIKLELALKEQAAVQEMVHGLTAEAGRGLRSFRQQAFEVLKANDTEKMEQLLKKIRGRTDTEKIAEMLGHLDPSDPIAVNRFIQQLYKPKAMDYLTELFYNSILSGPKTHIVNMISNTVNAIMSPIERMGSVFADIPLSLIQGRARTHFLNEIPADVWGAVRGLPEGFRQFAYVIKNGISLDEVSKWEFKQKAFKGTLGTVINMPSRFLEGADQLMKAVNIRAALNATAHRLASMEKLKGKAFEERVAELLSNPTESMLKEAQRVAEYRLFRQEPGKFGQTLMNIRDTVDIGGIKPLRFVFPFVRTPMNLVKYGLERTPLGFLNPELWKNLAKKSPEAADQIARAMIGTIGLGALTWYCAEGKITGAPPRNAAERERFYREGKQPYAIRVGDVWVSYQRLEPFNQLLSQTSMLSDMISNNDKGMMEKLADLANTFGQNFVSQSYMSSVSDLIDMLSEPERYAGNWLNRFAASMAVPFSGAVKTAAQIADSTVRDPQNMWETIKANIPGLSQSVQAKLTALGEDVTRTSPAWFPVNITPVEETVLSQELERLKFNIGMASTTISNIKLTDEEQREYQELVGKTIKDDLQKLMVDPAYWTATDDEKNKMLDSTVTAARNYVRDQMREKLWGTGTPEERLTILNTALTTTENRLGTVLSDAPDLSNGEPDIYTMTDLDTSYNTLLKDIPLNDLNNVTPTVKGWYDKKTIEDTLSILPDKKLYQVNGDTAKGDTIENYYTQWQEYNKITDEREKEAFLKKYPNASMGNITRRQLELLREYNKLDKKGQAQFLKDHPEIDINPYQDYLKAHPLENAQLAIWGDAKLLTQKAYDEYQKLIKEYDIPDSALMETKLPEGSVENYFKYVDIQTERGANSWEAQLLMIDDPKLREYLLRDIPDTPREALELKIKHRDLFDLMDNYSDKDSANYLDDTIIVKDGKTARQIAVEKLKADNPDWVEDMHRIDAIEKGTFDNPTSDAIINEHLEYSKIIDTEGLGSTSAEAMLYRVDNPDYNEWRMSEAWGDNSLQPVDQTKIAGWRIDVKYRKQDAEYDALPETGPERADYLATHEEYRLDRRRREAYALTNKEGVTFPLEQVENYVTYYETDSKGFRQERYLLENPDFANAMHTIKGIDLPDPAKVPAVQYDDIYDQYKDQFEMQDGYADFESPYYIEDVNKRQAAYDALRFTNGKDGQLTGFGKAEIRRDAYAKFVPDEYVDRYTDYYTIEKQGIPASYPNMPYYEDDWYLMEHPDFYQNVYLGLLGHQGRDFSKVPPTREIGALWIQYNSLSGDQERKNFRIANPDLEAWMEKALDYKPLKKSAKTLTPEEEKFEEIEQVRQYLADLGIGK